MQDNLHLVENSPEINSDKPLDKKYPIGVFSQAMKRKQVPERVQFVPGPEDKAILEAGRRKFGIALPDVLRMALRRLAEHEGLELKAS